MEGEGVEHVGEGGGRGRLRGSFTRPSKGRGTPGRCRRGAWRGPKGSLTVPGRGSLGGSPSNEDMRGGGGILFPLGPIPPRSTPSGLSGRGRERGRSIGTNTPPTMTAEGTEWWEGGGEGRWGMGGGGGLGMGGGGPKKWDGGGCWWRWEGGGDWMFSGW